MLFFQYLYALVIGPLELVFKIIFSILNKYIPLSGVNILLLSLAFSLLVLPLYMRADKIQEEAREQEDKLGPTIKHIKQYFKGDERFMILQTFYRQNNYSPLGVLKSSSCRSLSSLRLTGCSQTTHISRIRHSDPSPT